MKSLLQNQCKNSLLVLLIFLFLGFGVNCAGGNALEPSVESAQTDGGTHLADTAHNSDTTGTQEPTHDLTGNQEPKEENKEPAQEESKEPTQEQGTVEVSKELIQDGGGPPEPTPESVPEPKHEAMPEVTPEPLTPPPVKPVKIKDGMTFAAIAKKMKSGEWVEYNTTPTKINYFKNGGGGHDLSWADTAVWDQKAQCIYHYGGGHIKIPALSVYCVATNTWIRGKLPHWLDLKGSIWGYTNHGYDRNAFDPKTRTLYFYRGRQMWEFKPATSTWSKTNLKYGNSSLRDAATFFPGLGVITLRGEPKMGLYIFDTATKTQKVIPNAVLHRQLHTFSAYSPKHDVMLYGGGDGNKKVYILDRKLKTKQVADSPYPIRTVSGGTAGGWVTVDPKTGDFLALFAQNAELHRYNPKTNKWTRIGLSPFKPKLARTVAASLHDHGVILFASKTGDKTAKITLYKP